MLILYFLQTAVPLALIGWLGLAPRRSVAGFWTQSLATAVSLAAVALVGIWTFPPWWAVWGLAALLTVAITSALVRKRGMAPWPSGAVGWAVLAGFGALTLTPRTRPAARLLRRPGQKAW